MDIRFVGHAFQDSDTKDENLAVRCEGCGKYKYRLEVWSDNIAKNIRILCSKNCWKKEIKNGRTT